MQSPPQCIQQYLWLCFMSCAKWEGVSNSQPYSKADLFKFIPGLWSCLHCSVLPKTNVVLRHASNGIYGIYSGCCARETDYWAECEKAGDWLQAWETHSTLGLICRRLQAFRKSCEQQDYPTNYGTLIFCTSRFICQKDVGEQLGILEGLQRLDRFVLDKFRHFDISNELLNPVYDDLLYTITSWPRVPLSLFTDFIQDKILIHLVKSFFEGPVHRSKPILFTEKKSPDSLTFWEEEISFKTHPSSTEHCRAEENFQEACHQQANLEFVGLQAPQVSQQEHLEFVPHVSNLRWIMYLPFQMQFQLWR